MLRKHTINKNFFLIIITTLFCTSIIAKNLPIVLIHGILSDEYAMVPAKEHIQEYLPDVYVKNIRLGEGRITSLFNMHDQVEWLKQEMEADEQLQDGCIIIAHSQGGLVARYFIEKYNNPRVYIYIAWGTPQAGIFGAPDKIDTYIPWLKILQQISYKFAYSPLMQRLISFAGYWKHPLHYEKYLQGCTFLPFVNNEIDHADAALFKANICNLACMVLVQSTQDEVVVPVSSCHFGFHPIGFPQEIENLFDSQWYNDDALGLKTLAESGRLHLKLAHCPHSELQSDEYNFVENTLPYLTYEAP